MKQTLIFGGDFSVPSSDPNLSAAKLCEGVMPILDGNDIRMFQLEEAYVAQPVERSVEGNLTKTLDCIKGKVDLVTLSGNHFYDFQEDGVEGTIGWCEANNVAHVGGGHNLKQSREPAFIEKNGVKIGVCAFNAVGGKQQFATENRGGTNPITFTRAYVPVADLPWEEQVKQKHEFDNWSLKNPIHIDADCMGFNFVNPQALIDFAQQVRETKEQCDICIAYFHKGYVHRQVLVDDWERLISHIAIDNGADVVMASHSHIAHGVEFYKGKAIYHGLNNFVMYTPQLAPGFTGKVHGDAHNEEWVKQRIARFGFVPDPEYPTYPFHPDSIYCPVAKLVLDGKKIVEFRMILMVTEKSGIPYVHGQDEQGKKAFEFMQRITDEAGLNAKLTWDGEEVILTTK